MTGSRAEISRQSADSVDATPYLASAVTVLVGKIVFDWLKPGKTNGNSGERPVEFWRIEFREAVEDVFQTHRLVMVDSVIEVRRSLDEIINNQKVIAERLSTLLDRTRRD